MSLEVYLLATNRECMKYNDYQYNTKLCKVNFWHWLIFPLIWREICKTNKLVFISIFKLCKLLQNSEWNLFLFNELYVQVSHKLFLKSTNYIPNMLSIFNDNLIKINLLIWKNIWYYITYELKSHCSNYDCFECIVFKLNEGHLPWIKYIIGWFIRFIFNNKR